MSADAESSPATRPSLLVRLRDWGQQTAWREFDHNYAPLLRNVALKAGLTDAEADEVAQETLIAVAKKIGQFEHAGHRGSFRAWLYQQARWRIADQFRSRESRDPSEPLGSAHREPAEEREQPDEAFQTIWNAEWAEHIHQSALAVVKRRAGARQFQLFDLHVIQGLPVRDAAKAAGATTAAVFMAKSRVARMVRKEIQRLRAEEG